MGSGLRRIGDVLGRGLWIGRFVGLLTADLERVDEGDDVVEIVELGWIGEVCFGQACVERADEEGDVFEVDDADRFGDIGDVAGDRRGGGSRRSPTGGDSP